MTDKKDQAPKQVAAEEKKTPLEWAKVLGHEKRHGRKGAPETRVLLSPEYAAANVLYGWDKQAHHWGADSFKLTEKDFTAAIAASMKYPTVRPHNAAIPKVSEGKFADFEPLKAHKD